MPESLSFSSTEEEIEYWKSKYEETKTAFEEYKEDRAHAEEEQEIELMDLETKALDFELKYEQEKQEKDDLIVSSFILC